MKNILIVFYFIVFFVFSSSAKHFWFGQLMNLKQTCKRWGGRAFDEIQFKEAGREGENKRAKMTCSLIRNKKKYVGKKREEIREALGDYTGHYFSDMYPTYLIESSEKHGEDSWQIVFLINNKGKVKNIVVHKNCCDP